MPDNPFGSLGGIPSVGGTAASAGGGSPFGALGGSPNLSSAQELNLAYLKLHKSSGNFLSQIASGAGSALGTTLNYLMRPVDAVMGATTAMAKAGDQWNLKTWSAGLHGAIAGIEGKSYNGQGGGPNTFSDYLRTEYPNFAKNHKVWTAIGGLAGEIAFDPLLPLTAGGSLIHDAGAIADVARLADKIDVGSSLVERLGNTQAAAKALEDIGPGFDARRIFANIALQKNEAEVAAEAGIKPLGKNIEGDGFTMLRNDPNQLGKVTDTLPFDSPSAAKILGGTAKSQEYIHAAGAAARESMASGKTVAQLRFGKIPLTPTAIAGTRVAPMIPTLARMATKAGVLGKIPGVAPTAQAIGTMLKHGFNDAEFAKPALEAKHFATHINGNLTTHSEATITRPFRDMSHEDMLDAFHVGETHPGVVTGPERSYHADVVAKTHLKPEQQAFLQAYHNHANAALAVLKDHGVQLERPVGDKVYVPHNFNTEGGVIRTSAVRSAMGLTKARASEETNLRDIASSVNDKVRNLSVETNPHTIIAMMNLNTATEAANQTMLRHMTLAAGTASRVPDIVKRAKAVEKVGVLQTKQDKLKLLVHQKAWRNKTSRAIRDKARKRLQAAIDDHGRKVEEIHAHVLLHTGEHLVSVFNKTSRTPSWSTFKSIGKTGLQDTIGHFNSTDRRVATKLHDLLGENKRLTDKLDKLGDPKGGPAAAHQALAHEVSTHLQSQAARGSTISHIDQLKPSARGESWKGNIKKALEVDRAGLRERYGDISKRYPNERAVNHMALAKRAQARISTEEQRFLTKAERIGNDMKLDKAKAEIQFEKDFETQSRLHNSYQAKIDSATRIANHASMANPNIPSGFVEWKRTIDGVRYHFPPEIHEAMTRITSITNSAEEMKRVADAMRGLMQKWKIGVTSLNPGYAARNHFSELWNMHIDGISFAHIAQYNAKTLSLIRTVHKIGTKYIENEALTGKELLALRQMNEMAGQGILNGLFQGDVQEASKMFSSKSRARDYLVQRKIGHAYVRLTQDYNRNRENMNRMTSYLYHRQHQGMSAYDSANRTKASLFDYQELTPTEQGKFKLIVPFWTWTRKNIPYQLQRIIEQPGKFSDIGKVAMTSNELASGTPFGKDTSEGTIPAWMTDGYGFRVPGFGQETYYQPNFGINDLSKLEHPSTAISMLNPAAGIVYTAATGTNSFTKQPVVGSHPRNPINGWAADVLKYLPGADVGQTSREVNGQTVTGAGINPWYSYALSQLPETNLLNTFSNIKQQQRGGPGFIAAQYALGAPLYKRDIPSETVGAQLNEQTAEQRWARGLRDAGVVPPTKKKNTSAFQAQVNSIISGG